MRFVDVQRKILFNEDQCSEEIAMGGFGSGQCRTSGEETLTMGIL